MLKFDSKLFSTKRRKGFYFSGNSGRMQTMSVPDPEEDKHSETERVTAVIILVAIMLLAAIGNVFVISVIYMFRRLREDITYILTINLCITDLANTCLVMMSALAGLIVDGWPFGKLWCDCVCAVNYLLIIVSMLTLCAISVVRYQAVLHPYSYPTRVTSGRLLVAIVLIWCQGLAFSIPPSAVQWVQYDDWERICAIQWHLHHPGTLIYVVFAFVLCFLGPGIVLIYCYVRIIKEARKNQGPAHMAAETQESGRRITLSLLSVVVAYFICTAPFSVTKLIKVSSTNPHIVPGLINLAAALLGYVASGINPLLYGIFRKDFRRAYKRLSFAMMPKRLSLFLAPDVATKLYGDSL